MLGIEVLVFWGAWQGKCNLYTYKQNSNTLASLCSWAGLFQPYIVSNSENRPQGYKTFFMLNTAEHLLAF